MSSRTHARANTPKLPYVLVDNLQEIRNEIAEDGFDSQRAIYRFNADMAWLEKEYGTHMPVIGNLIDRMKSAGMMMGNANELRRKAYEDFETIETELEKLERNSTHDDE